MKAGTVFASVVAAGALSAGCGPAMPPEASSYPAVDATIVHFNPQVMTAEATSQCGLDEWGDWTGTAKLTLPESDVPTNVIHTIGLAEIDSVDDTDKIVAGTTIAQLGRGVFVLAFSDDRPTQRLDAHHLRLGRYQQVLKTTLDYDATLTVRHVTNSTTDFRVDCQSRGTPWTRQKYVTA
jgi:hypothetical protein